MQGIDIENKVLGIVAELLKREAKIAEHDDLLLLGLDSISAIKIIVYIEGEFGFEVNDEDLLIENFNTIYKIKEYIRMKLKTN